MADDNTGEISEIIQEEADFHSESNSTDDTAEEEQMTGRDQDRKVCWRIQATNALAYYQFAMLHFLQEVLRSQIVVGSERGKSAKNPNKFKDSVTFLASSYKEDVEALLELMNFLLTELYATHRNANPNADYFVLDILTEDGSATAFKTDRRNIPAEYITFQQAELDQSRSGQIKTMYHHKAAEVTFKETIRSVDVLIKLIEKGSLETNGIDTSKAEYDNYKSHLKHVKYAVFYIQKTRREMLRTRKDDSFGSGINPSSDIEEKEYNLWKIQHDLFWARIGWRKNFSENERELKNFIKNTIFVQQQHTYVPYDDGIDVIPPDDMIVIAQNTELAESDTRQRMKPYYCTQRFMLFWVHKIRNSIREFSFLDDYYDEYGRRFEKYVEMYNSPPPVIAAPPISRNDRDLRGYRGTKPWKSRDAVQEEIQNGTYTQRGEHAQETGGQGIGGGGGGFSGAGGRRSGYQGKNWKPLSQRGNGLGGRGGGVRGGEGSTAKKQTTSFWSSS